MKQVRHERNTRETRERVKETLVDSARQQNDLNRETETSNEGGDCQPISPEMRCSMEVSDESITGETTFPMKHTVWLGKPSPIGLASFTLDQIIKPVVLDRSEFSDKIPRPPNNHTNPNPDFTGNTVCLSARFGHYSYRPQIEPVPTRSSPHTQSSRRSARAR